MAEKPLFRAAHCRAARALLGLTQAELATAAGVGVMTMKRFEADRDVRAAQANAILRSLSDRGIVFLNEGSVCDGNTVVLGVALTADPDKR